MKLLAIAALLSVALANATCKTGMSREELINSHRLAKYHLTECREMGGGDLDASGLEKALQLSEEIEKAIAAGSWAKARRAIPQLEQTVFPLLERMKEWDADGDGLSNYAEFILYGTSWNSGDTDGDGYLDSSEILRYETDPLDHCAVPLSVPYETEVECRCPALEELLNRS